MGYDYYLFQDESGEPAKGPFFIIGVLITTLDGVQCIRRKVRDVRKECRFYNEFHWWKLSRKRANAYRRLIRAVWDCPWRYEGIIVSNRGFDLRYFKDSEESEEIGRFRAYNRFTRLLLENRLEYFPGRAIMIADKKDRMKADNFAEYIPEYLFDEAFRRDSPALLVRVIQRDSKQVAALQLVDLITGIIATNRRRGFRPPQTPKELLAAEIAAMDGFRDRVRVWVWQSRR